MSDIAEAKRKLQLPALLHQIGLGERAKKSARCPFHDDKNNSFSIFRTNGNGSWRWKCFACNEDGDEIDLVARVENLSKGDAIRRYCVLAGVNGSKLQPLGAAFRQAKAIVQREPVPTKPEALNWQSCVDAFTSEHSDKLSKWRGLSPEFCEWLREEKLIGLHNGLFAFPVRDAQNNVVGAHVCAEDRKGWFYHPKGTGATPLLIAKLTRGEVVHVFESTWDGLAFLDVSGERSGVVIARGSSNAKQIAPLISECLYCVVWTQNDEAGTRFEKDLVAATTCAIKRAQVPEPHKDLNDWTRAGATSEDLLNAVIKAESLRASRCELSDLLDSIVAVLRRYVVFPLEEQAEVIALWVAHTWTFCAFDYTPYLFVFAAAKRSGKSRVLEVLELLARNAKKTESGSSAALIRIIDDKRPPAFLLDEVDKLYTGKKSSDGEADSTCRFLNAGYRRGSKFLRCVGQGSAQEPKEFPAFCPKALAGIGRCIPDTVADRSIPIELARQTRENRAERLRDREARVALAPLVAELEAWAQHPGVIDALRDARPVSPDELHDRAQDICEPLLAIADMAGGDWPRKARAALIKLYAGEEDADIGVMLLADIKRVFDEKKTEKLFTETVIRELVANADDAPWAFMFEDALKHDRLDSAASKLAKKLKAYHIKPSRFRIGEENKKGYQRAQFEEAWRQYLPPSLPLPKKGEQAEQEEQTLNLRRANSCSPFNDTSLNVHPSCKTGGTRIYEGKTLDVHGVHAVHAFPGESKTGANSVNNAATLGGCRIADAVLRTSGQC